MKYFGTDGIRGIAGEFLTAELAFRVGTALAVLGLSEVMIGRDTRESGPMLTDNIADGAKFVGLNVRDLGVVSTPMLCYLCGKQKAVGVMITASHNPFTDNGIKVFQSGKKLYAADEQALEDVLNGTTAVPKAKTNGTDLVGINSYEEYFQLYHSVCVPTSLSLAMDLANGACFEIGPRVFSTFCDHLHLTGNTPDGRNINEGVGSTHLEHLQKFVLENHCDYGFALDGDGDRLLVIDQSGTIFDGDMLIYVIANYLKQKGKLIHSTVVLTKMSNLGIIQAFERRGIKVFLADVGDKYVLEALETHDFTVGGENSGHLINRTLLNTGDGVLNAAFLIKVLEETHQSLKQLTQDIVLFPDKLVNLKNVNKTLVTHPEVTALVARWQTRLGGDGKILVRASGTEPLIRVSVSAKTLELLEECQQEIIGTILRLNKN